MCAVKIKFQKGKRAALELCPPKITSSLTHSLNIVKCCYNTDNIETNNSMEEPMKAEFYDRSKRANIYNTIYIYKILSLIVLVALTVTLTVLFFKDRAKLEELEKVEEVDVPAFLVLVAVCLMLFIISILLDFYILRRTASIGRHLNKMAYIDRLTGLPNRFSCDLLIDSFNSPERLPGAGFILMQISNLRKINDKEGHDNGNWLISEFCSILEDVSEAYGYAGRNGGNEFILLIDECDSTAADLFLADLTKRIHGYNEMNVGAPLEVAYARVLNCDEHKEKMSEIVSLGYKKIHQEPQVLS